MWVGHDQFNTIAYPLDQLPSISAKRELVASLSREMLIRRRQEADALLEELMSAVGDPPEGSGHVDQQVDDLTIESVDWQAVISSGDFKRIRTADEWWRVDLAGILDDLLYDLDVE